MVMGLHSRLNLPINKPPFQLQRSPDKAPPSLDPTFPKRNFSYFQLPSTKPNLLE